MDPKHTSVILPTDNELEVVHWSMNGKRDAEIGKLLGITAKAASNRINRAMDRLGALTRTQLGAIMASKKTWL